MLHQCIDRLRIDAPAMPVKSPAPASFFDCGRGVSRCLPMAGHAIAVRISGRKKPVIGNSTNQELTIRYSRKRETSLPEEHIAQSGSRLRCLRFTPGRLLDHVQAKLRRPIAVNATALDIEAPDCAPKAWLVPCWRLPSCGLPGVVTAGGRMCVKVRGTGSASSTH